MSTYTQIIYHIVFSTKGRQGTLDIEKHESLFRYIWGIIKNKQSTLHQVNGTADHLHILTELHPSIALSDFVKDIKLACSQWIRTEKILPYFEGWQEGYGAFTHSRQENLVWLNISKHRSNIMRICHSRMNILRCWKRPGLNTIRNI